MKKSCIKHNHKVIEDFHYYDMDVALENLLKQHDIYDEVHSVLEANEIDSIQMLTILSKSEEFKDTFPSLRCRLKIKEALKNVELESIVEDSEKFDSTPSESIHQESLEGTIFFAGDQSFTSETASSTPIRPSSSASNYEVINIIQQPSYSQPIVLETTRTIDHDLSAPMSKRLRLDVTNFNLSDLLDQTITGRALKAIYENFKEFEPKYQGYLCDLIVQHFLNRPAFQRLSNEDLSEIADAVIHLFPCETKTTYYTEPLRKKYSRENKSGFARGKLTDKYRNRLTFLRKAGLIPCVREVSSTCTSENSETILEVVGEIQEDVVWLQHNSEPWNIVETKWRNTFEYRHQLLQNSTVEVQKITEIFNIINHPLGYTLLDLDFKEIYKDSYGKLFTSFDKIFQVLVQLRKQNLNKTENLLMDILENTADNLSSNSREYMKLSLLGSLLPTKTFKRSSKAWIPSTDECKEGVVVHVKIPADIPIIVESKKKKVGKYGLTLQPFIIIEGPTYNNIVNIFVSFNDTLYKVNSVLKALDTCFQLITLLNLKYPYESEHIWLFIQKSMYNIHTKYDNLPNILDIANKIKNRLE